MYDRLAPRGFEVLAFPCNQFGGQEPGTAAEIRKFVSGYGVKFPVFGKIDVNGPNTHPLYAFLKSGTPFLSDIVRARRAPQTPPKRACRKARACARAWQRQQRLTVLVSACRLRPTAPTRQKWNFGKFLVDKEGKVVQRYGPPTTPLSIEEDIAKLL